MSSGAEGQAAVRRSVLRVVLESPRPVYVLVAGVFINRAGSFFATFLVLFLRQLGFSVAQMPVVLLIVGAATPIGAMIGGWAADRFGRKASLVGSTCLSAAAMTLIGLSPNRTVALIGIFIGAFFAQTYLPAASALLVDHTPEDDRIPVFAFFRLALNLGAALGPVAAAFIAPHGLKLLFLVSACCYSAFTVVLIVGLAPATAAGAPAKSPSASAGDSRRGRLPVALLAFYGAVLAITMVYAQYSSTVSLAVSAAHGTSFYAALLTLNAVLIICVEIPLTSLTRRPPWWIPILAGTAAMAIGMAISGAFGSYLIIASGVVIWSVGEMLFSPVVNTAVAAMSPADKIGRYQGYLATVQGLAFAVGPAIGVLVYGYSPGALWAGCLAVGLLASGGVVLAGRVRKNATRSQPEPYLLLESDGTVSR